MNATLDGWLFYSLRLAVIVAFGTAAWLAAWLLEVFRDRRSRGRRVSTLAVSACYFVFLMASGSTVQQVLWALYAKSGNGVISSLVMGELLVRVAIATGLSALLFSNIRELRSP